MFQAIIQEKEYQRKEACLLVEYQRKEDSKESPFPQVNLERTGKKWFFSQVSARCASFVPIWPLLRHEHDVQ